MKLYDEISYAKKLENTDFTNDDNHYRHLILLVRYWRTLGETEETIRDRLLDILSIIYKNFASFKLYSHVENILAIAKVQGNLKHKSIRFSKEELDYIHSFNQLGLEKALFIMFSAYKLSDHSNRFELNEYELMVESHNSYSRKYADSILHKIVGENNIFKIDIFHNSKLSTVKMLYFPTQSTLDLYNENNIILEITDFKNIVYYYLEYIGVGKYIRCKECGCIEEKKSNRQTYCVDCKKQKELKQKRDYINRIRNN